MLKQPLFGQDSSPHITSMCISSLVTLVCWIIFCILCLVVKFKPQTPEYKEIQIVLDSTPVVEQPVEEQSASAEQQSAVAEQESVVAEPVEAPELPNPVEKPVAEAKIEAPKTQPSAAKPKAASQPKTQTNTTKTDPSKKVDFDNMQYATDYSDFDFNNTSKPKANWDESMFANSQSGVETTNNQTETVQEKSGFSKESAGTVSNQGKTALRSNDNSKDEPYEVLYNDSIEKVRKAVVAKGTGSRGIETSLSSNTNSASSNSITMRDGSTRKIIKSSPINLSEEASKTIDFNEMTVTITFRVLTNGNVLPSSIKIDKAIFLDNLVINEINDQIKLWLLAPSDSEAEAIFELTIKRK